MRPRGVIATALLLLASIFLRAPAATAGPSADAHTDDGGIDTEARNRNDGDIPAVDGRDDKAEPPPLRCEYTLLDPEHSAIADRLADKGWGNPRGEGEGAWYRQVCYLQNGDGAFGDVVWLPASRAVDLQALAAEARDRLALPAPALRMSPPIERAQVVNVASWLYIDSGMWAPRSSSVSVPGVTVTARAEPLRVIWDMGDGGPPIVCNGPGRPYDPSVPDDQQTTDCSYTWRRTSAREPEGRFRVTATVEWHATWAVTGAAGGGDLGTVGRSLTVGVRVAEAQAVRSRPEP